MYYLPSKFRCNRFNCMLAELVRRNAPLPRVHYSVSLQVAVFLESHRRSSVEQEVGFKLFE